MATSLKGLEAGRRVQHAFMPPRAPQVPGWSLWLYTKPANEVGGDLVDFVSVHDERRMIIRADVAGKGLKAALLMANLQATMRALAPDYASLAHLVGKVNEIFRRNTLPNVFASLLAVDFSPSSGDVHYVNAGHFPPLLLRPEGSEQTGKGEAALGLIPGSVYSDHKLKLRPGEAFLGYSDGLTEARNAAGEFYGSERLLQLLSTLRNRDAKRSATPSLPILPGSSGTPAQTTTSPSSFCEECNVRGTRERHCRRGREHEESPVAGRAL